MQVLGLFGLILSGISLFLLGNYLWHYISGDRLGFTRVGARTVMPVPEFLEHYTSVLRGSIYTGVPALLIDLLYGIATRDWSMFRGLLAVSALIGTIMGVALLVISVERGSHTDYPEDLRERYHRVTGILLVFVLISAVSFVLLFRSL